MYTGNRASVPSDILARQQRSCVPGSHFGSIAALALEAFSSFANSRFRLSS